MIVFIGNNFIKIFLISFLILINLLLSLLRQKCILENKIKIDLLTHLIEN